MANFDGYGKAEEVVLSTFGGLNRVGPLCGGKQCFELRNLRPLQDGTLVRREGYGPLVTLDATVRGVFEIERNGQKEAYAVAGSEVYYLEMGSGSCTPRALGSIGTEQGGVRFFCFDRQLLLFDGQEIWALTPDRLCLMQPYIPLYGKDWNFGDDGLRTVCEVPNVLCNQLRIRFRPTSLAATYYFVELPVRSVDEIYVNGARYENSYTFDEQKQTVKLSNGYDVGTVVEMIVTVKDGFCGDRASVTGAADVASVGDAENERILFYGGSVPTGSVRMSRAIMPTERDVMRAMRPECCMLYLTEQDTLMLGDGLHAVTGACRHYDRSLIFTENATWMADGALNESGMLRLIPVNTALGCSRVGAYTVIGNEPISVMLGRVLRWNSKTDERNECNAEVISAELEPLLGADFGKNTAVFGDARRGEVWLYTPGKVGRIFIRDEQNKCWTIFDGFVPSGMFCLGDTIGFYEGQTVFLFDPTAYCDTDAQGNAHGIEAEMQSSFLDFGHAGRIKRLVGATVMASCASQHFELVLRHVSGRERVVPLQGDGTELSVMQARTNSGRFRYLRLGIRCSDIGPWHLHGVRLTAR